MLVGIYLELFLYIGLNLIGMKIQILEIAITQNLLGGELIENSIVLCTSE